MDIPQQIQALQEEIRQTPYHKGTEHYIGKLRARIARLKDKAEIPFRQGSGGTHGYAMRKQGDATVVLVGPPSVGKSTLINQLTNTQSKVAQYEFTTTSVIPGMMKYKNASIQLMDLPGLIQGAEEGKGRGREVLSVVRNADLLLIITEPEKLSAFKSILDSLERNGIRVNQPKPKITLDKKTSGSVIIHSNFKQEMSVATIKEIVSEIGYKNAEITLKEKVTVDILIDALSKNRVYPPAVFIINKCDLLDNHHNIRQKILADFGLEVRFISAESGLNLEELKEHLWQKLKLVRIYLVKKDDNPGLNDPFIARENQTLLKVAASIGEEFSQSLDHAVIWGPGAKFPGQEVSLTTKVQEGMQIRFV